MGGISYDPERKVYILVSGEDSLTVTEKQFQDISKGQSTLFSYLKKKWK